MGDIAEFFVNLNKGVNSTEALNIDLDAVPSLLRFSDVAFQLATVDGEIQGIRYRRGFRVEGTINAFLADISGKVALQEQSILGARFSDFEFGLSLELIPIHEIILNLIEDLFPGLDLGFLDDVLSLWDVSPVQPEDIIGIKKIALEEFSLFGIVNGQLPELSVSFVIAGQELELSTNISLASLTESLTSIFEASNIEEDMPECVSDQECENSPNGPFCDHTVEPWICVEKCKKKGDNVPEAGCFAGAKQPKTAGQNVEAYLSKKKSRSLRAINFDSYVYDETKGRYTPKRRLPRPLRYLFKRS